MNLGLVKKQSLSPLLHSLTSLFPSDLMTRPTLPPGAHSGSRQCALPPCPEHTEMFRHPLFLMPPPPQIFHCSTVHTTVYTLPLNCSHCSNMTSKCNIMHARYMHIKFFFFFIHDTLVVSSTCHIARIDFPLGQILLLYNWTTFIHECRATTVSLFFLLLFFNLISFTFLFLFFFTCWLSDLSMEYSSCSIRLTN